ncbi:bifunctional 5,10-methylenetetrahydrofolate dehydrogenase/5,10-methenyltetrahydrofolate cyclohydrolase [Candidatus Poribacteria bacterium]|nr:bifunctional 5,10-methylenetetrahydrofolate dehydrogenase/5,10-methenyltetrahydrofolate cyclohydrolase [Candidatus Poribacteria bacterium]
MSAEIIDGKKIARTIEREVAKEVESFRADTGVTPHLTVVLVGDDPASHVYVNRKGQACERVGITEKTIVLPASTTEDELLALIDQLNAAAAVNGILVQMPLPRQISSTRVIEALDYRKDVDGFHPTNVGQAVVGAPLFEPCTPSGIVEMMLRARCEPAGKHAVILGRSNVVGKPLMNMLVQKTPRGNATVTVCHTATPDFSVYTRDADIVIAAAGSPEVVTGEMLKPGCAVIDVGVNRVADESAPKGYRIVGDVHFESASQVASAISPVPGGVGPMTIAMLVRNTIRAANLQHSRSGV